VNGASEYADWVARGRAHQQEGRPVDAMLCFRRASRADSRAADPFFSLGEVLWQLGRLADAITAWREAERLAPRFLAPRQALAEALLATGDAKAAHAAAGQVLALAPDNARAELIVAIARLLDGDAAERAAPIAAIDSVLARAPALACVASLAGPLALALDRAGATPERAALLLRIMRSPEALTMAPLLLLALALESNPPGTTPDTAAERATLIEATRSREIAPVDIDALRRIAVAIASDSVAADEFARRHAELCASSMAPPVPFRWPRRTAGDRTRVLLLAVNESAESAVPEAAANLSPEAFALTAATLGPARSAMPSGVTHLILPISSDAAAKAIAALDLDVLVDLAGMSASTGTLLAQRPARQTWTLAPLPHAPPLIDRAFAEPRALAEALRHLHDARDRASDCALDASAMSAVWTEAVREHQRGERASALAGYARVLEQQPAFAPAHYLSGAAHRDDGDTAAARAAFAAALVAAPHYVEARLAAANAAIAAGDTDAAVELCSEGLTALPFDAGLLRTLGQAHLVRHDGAAAADAFLRALRSDMTDADTHYNLGVALQMQRQFSEAARAYQRALAFRPDFVAAHFNLGVLFQEQGMTAAAITAYGEVIAVDPGNVAAHRNLGEVLLAAGRIDDYLANFRHFESRCPEALPLAVQALVACQHMGDFAKLDRYLEGLGRERFAAANEKELVDALEELLYLLLYFDVDPSMVAQFAHTYDSVARHVYGAALPRPPARRPGRVRIGYLSGDLRNHVMGKMAWSAVQRHDKARFELYFYSLSETDDEWTAKFRGLADHFQVIAGETERAAALRIAADDLDILVDLATHTKGAKPGILALKPARVQITHIASAGTVGLSTIDFKLTDRYADMPDNQAFQIEAMLPMEGCVYPYRHIDVAAQHPFQRTALGISADTIVIGAFVSPQKLSRRCLASWREVLARLPKARLLFSPVDPALCASYARLLAAAGIAAERMLFLPQGRNDAENQARYELVDFVLDPMPFGGVNGTLEALDMGVPVVTLQGKRHGERTSYSILANLGVTETVAASGTEYADIAERLATDPAFMRMIRGRIRDGLRQSTLVDVVAHTRSLERAYIAALEAKAPEALQAAGPTDG
jgi:predicted O-linked N-acetylglucosamine transferase (SPINDLY family)